METHRELAYTFQTNVPIEKLPNYLIPILIILIRHSAEKIIEANSDSPLLVLDSKKNPIYFLYMNLRSITTLQYFKM